MLGVQSATLALGETTTPVDGREHAEARANVRHRPTSHHVLFCMRKCFVDRSRAATQRVQIASQACPTPDTGHLDQMCSKASTCAFLFACLYRHFQKNDAVA